MRVMIFYMTSVEACKIRYVALFCETNLDCFSSVDNDKEQCRTQNAEKEVVYGSSGMFFLTGLLTHKRRAIHYNSKFI